MENGGIEKHRKWANDYYASPAGKKTIARLIARQQRTDITIEQIAEVVRSGTVGNENIRSALGCGVGTLYRVVRDAGYSGLAEFINTCNHKVVSVTPAGRADVYDLTVDRHHNFALGVGVFVHNSKDVADCTALIVSKLLEIVGGEVSDAGNAESMEQLGIRFARWIHIFRQREQRLPQIVEVANGMKIPVDVAGVLMEEITEEQGPAPYQQMLSALGVAPTDDEEDL